MSIIASDQQLMLEIPSGVLHAILHDCAERAPAEACGALIGRPGGVVTTTAARALPNRALRTHAEYRIAASDIKQLEDSTRAHGVTIVGFYHSHPNGAPEPSAIDIESAWPGYVYLIAGTRSGESSVEGWKLREDRTGFDPVEVACRL